MSGELHSYLYTMWNASLHRLIHSWWLPVVLYCPQGLGRCYLLHMYATGNVKYLAFNLTEAHCTSSVCMPNLLRSRWTLNLPSSMPAVRPSSVPSVGLASPLSLQWWWQSGAVHLDNSSCVHFLPIFLNLKSWPLGARLPIGDKILLSIEMCCSHALCSAAWGRSLSM